MTLWEKIRATFRLPFSILREINVPEVTTETITLPTDYVQQFKKLLNDYSVEVKSLPRDVPRGYFVKPRNEEVCFAIIVLHTSWGLTSHIKGVCDRLARSGFVVMAPDFYNGGVANSPETAEELCERMDGDDVVAVVEHYVRFLNQLPFVKRKKFCLIGFGVGGTYALLAAGRLKNFVAVADFCGVYPKPVEELAHIDCPLLVLAAGEDTVFGSYEIKRMDDAFKEYELQGVIHVYEKAGADFFDDSRVHAYNYSCSEDGWKRMMVFLNRRLAGEEEAPVIPKAVLGGSRFTGTKKVFFKDGTVYREINYKNGKLEGLYRQYYQKGGLRRECEYHEDKRKGPAREYYANGRPSMEGQYANDKLDGVIRHFYANGNLKLVETYRGGKLEGESKEYYEDGRIRYEWNFKDGTLEGLCKEYFSTGVVKSRTIYDQGEAISIKVFDEEGKLVWIMG